MITVDKIHKVLGEAETFAVPTSIEGNRDRQINYLLAKSLVYAIIYAAELVSKSIKNSS